MNADCSAGQPYGRAGEVVGRRQCFCVEMPLAATRLGEEFFRSDHVYEEDGAALHSLEREKGNAND